MGNTLEKHHLDWKTSLDYSCQPQTSPKITFFPYAACHKATLLPSFWHIYESRALINFALAAPDSSELGQSSSSTQADCIFLQTFQCCHLFSINPQNSSFTCFYSSNWSPSGNLRSPREGGSVEPIKSIGKTFQKSFLSLGIFSQSQNAFCLHHRSERSFNAYSLHRHRCKCPS